MAGGKTRLQEDLELLATYRLARMSIPTMAMMLGRSRKWVEARLDEMDAADEAAAAPDPADVPVVTPEEVVTQAEFARRRGVSKPTVSHWISRGVLSAAAIDRTDGSPRIRVETASAELDARSHLKAHSSPLRTSKQPAPEGKTTYQAYRPEAGRRPSAVETLKPVTPRVARWSWWFVAAGWPLEEVADLFDRCPEALGRAVETLA